MASCADGAGSASLADLGSQTACDRLAQQFLKHLAAALRDPAIADVEMRDAYETICTELAGMAASRSVPMRELACTLLGAIVYDQHAVFAQIGDGAIVVRLNGVYGPIFWPQSGEYSNTTNFVTDANSRANIMVTVVFGRIDELALFTDGIERLALQMNSQSVHAPFFDPLFESLGDAPDTEMLFEPLRTFLDSPQVNERTDDDKTLVLATRRVSGRSKHVPVL